MKQWPCMLLLMSMFLLGAVASCRVKDRDKSNSVEDLFVKAGLVDVHTVDSSIQVDLVNSSKRKNFFREDFYQGLKRAYLRKAVARKVARAQAILKAKNPELSLLIMDAARPNWVSHRMYEKMKGTKFERFVAKPDKGSMHNYGAAVDITIVDSRGRRLDMGFIPFYKSRIGIAFSYLFSRKGKLNPEQRRNRALLKRVMLEAGFKPLSHEWWHFNGFNKGYIRKTYSMIE